LLLLLLTAAAALLVLGCASLPPVLALSSASSAACLCHPNASLWVHPVFGNATDWPSLPAVRGTKTGCFPSPKKAYQNFVCSFVGPLHLFVVGVAICWCGFVADDASSSLVLIARRIPFFKKQENSHDKAKMVCLK
jgi:hypothetical protein